MALDGNARARMCVAKARAEIAQLEAAGVLAQGNAFSPILFVKGLSSEAERASGQPFCGADGKALRASLTALGYAPEDWAGLATWRQDGTPVGAELLRQALAALGPLTVVACDAEATQALREALAADLVELEDLDDALLVEGRVVNVAGMRVLSLGGFEAALADPHAKQVMWARLKRVPPLGSPY